MDTPAGGMSATDFRLTELPELVGDLQRSVESARTELAEAEREAAAWRAMLGTSRVHDGTKDRYIVPNLAKWQARVASLKGQITEAETDLKSFQEILAQP